MNKLRVSITSLITMVLIMLLIIIPALKTYAGEVKVTFDQESYEIRENSNFTVGVEIKASGGIGYYHIEIVYDKGRIDYKSGADDASDDGVLILEGTGTGDTITYNLNFYSAHSGPAGIAVDKAEMYGPDTSVNESYELDTNTTAAIEVDGTDILGYDFISDYKNILIEREASMEAERLAEEAEKAAQQAQLAETVSGNAIMTINAPSGETLYVVDHNSMLPEKVNWQYKLSQGVYNGEGVTYLTDASDNVQILYLADDAGNGYPYAIKDDKAYPVSMIIARDGREYIYVSAAAAKRLPETVSDNTALDGIIYAIDSDGVGDFYRLGINNELYPLHNDSASDNDAAGVLSSNNIIIIAAVVVIFIISQVILIRLIRRKDEDVEDEIEILDLDDEYLDEDEYIDEFEPEVTYNEVSQEEISEEVTEEPVISIQNVTMKFKISTSDASGLKEFLIQKFKKKVTYRELLALNDVSFDIYKGEVVGIIGTNGSGKSTLLRIVSGALSPTKGRVVVDRSKVQLLTLGTGFDMELTARENIYLNGAIIGYSKKFLDDHFDEIVEFAELGDFVDEKVKNFSSGMVSRLGFAIATAGDAAEILILDEVLSVGDEFFKKKSLARIKEMIHGGSTVLMVSHGMGTILENCSKVAWIEKGILQMVGEAKTVCAEYQKMGGM